MQMFEIRAVMKTEILEHATGAFCCSNFFRVLALRVAVQSLFLAECHSRFLGMKLRAARCHAINCNILEMKIEPS